MLNRIFTSESVTEGHPDKICDQISDAILDDLLRQDPNSRVACETCVTTGLVLVMGEITTNGYCDVQKIARSVVDEIGYNRGKYGFDAENLAVLVAINEQSPDIALGVDRDGAGDQGMMFGFACNETEEYMPMPIILAQKLARRLSEVRKQNIIKCLRPDGKTQVSVKYDEFGKPKYVETIVVSTQHDENVTQEELRELIIKHVIEYIVPSNLIDEAIIILKNNKRIKALERIESKNGNKNITQKSGEYIVKEAEMVISNYLSKVEKEKQIKSYSIKQIENRYKRLKAISIIMGVMLAINSILLF